MKNKNIVRGAIYFLAGILTASVVQFYYPGVKDALADQYACIRQDLDAQGMTGNIPAPQFTITYNVPSCYSNSGYTVNRVYMYGNQVAVNYKNAAATSGSNIMSLDKNAGGGMRPIP